MLAQYLPAESINSQPMFIGNSVEQTFFNSQATLPPYSILEGFKTFPFGEPYQLLSLLEHSGIHAPNVDTGR